MDCVVKTKEDFTYWLSDEMQKSDVDFDFEAWLKPKLKAYGVKRFKPLVDKRERGVFTGDVEYKYKAGKNIGVHIECVGRSVQVGLPEIGVDFYEVDYTNKCQTKLSAK